MSKRLSTPLAPLSFWSAPVFQRYVQKQPCVSLLTKVELQDWLWVQKQFVHLRLHRKQSDELNISTCQVTGPHKNKRLQGYLFVDSQNIRLDITSDNPYL
jgi:hypothetical protein